MQLILANIDEFSARAMVRLYEIGVELAVIRAAGGNGQSEIDQINWYSQLLIEANDTTQTDELRLKLLTVLVDNARLNEVPTPIGVYNIYQPLMGEVFGSVPFANITGLPLDNVALAAEFDKVLYKSGGTMTGPLLISPATRIDSTAALNIGTSTATTITIGRTGQNVSMPGTIIDALWGGLNIPVAKGGLGGLVFDDGANGQVPVKSGTGYVWGTPISGNDYVRIDGSSVMTGGLRLNATLSIDTNSAGTLGIGTGMATVLTIGRIGQAVLFPGTINSGVWHGTVIERPYGGFGNAMEAIPAGDRIYGYDIIDESSQMWEIGSRLSYDSGTKILTVNPNLSLTTLTATGLINGGSLASGVAATTAGTLVLRNATNSFTQTIRGTNPGANITYDLPTTAPTAGQYLTAGLPASGVSTLSWATLSALTNPMTTLGDTIYGGASGVATRLAGNTTTARQFLTSVGSAGLATAPVWATLVAGDIPNISTSQVTGLDTALMNKLGTTLASGKIFVGNGSGAAAPVFMNQDGTLSNTGALTISNGAITMAKMANATAQGNFMVRWSAGSGVWQEGTFGAGLTLDAFGVLSASGGGGGANTALSNLASVSINASLVPQTGLSLGGASTPWQYLYLYGGGTFGANNFQITGTATAARVWTLQDATDTFVGRATTDTLSNKTYGGVSLDVTGAVTSGVASTTAGLLVLRNSASAFTQTFRGTNYGSNIVYDWPTGTPTSGQVLSASAPSGSVITLSWATASGSGDMLLAATQTVTGAKTFNDQTLLFRNPANTFSYTLVHGAIAANRQLNLPVITATDTLAVLGLAQTFSAAQTFSNQIISSITGASTTPAISLTGSTMRWISYGSSTGVGSPVVTTRSAGSKIIFAETITGSNLDFGMGLETNYFWLSTPNTSNGYRFYTGPSNIPLTLTSAGLDLTGGASVYFKASSTAAGTATAYFANSTTWLTTPVSGALEWNSSGTNAGLWITLSGTRYRLDRQALLANPFVAVNSTKTGAYNITTADYYIRADGTSGAFTVTLPTASTCTGQVFVIKKIDSSINAITIGGTVDGVASPTLATQYSVMMVFSNGTTYDKLSAI